MHDWLGGEGGRSFPIAASSLTTQTQLNSQSERHSSAPHRTPALIREYTRGGESDGKRRDEQRVHLSPPRCGGQWLRPNYVRRKAAGQARWLCVTQTSDWPAPNPRPAPTTSNVVGIQPRQAGKAVPLCPRTAISREFAVEGVPEHLMPQWFHGSIMVRQGGRAAAVVSSRSPSRTGNVLFPSFEVAEKYSIHSTDK